MNLSDDYKGKRILITGNSGFKGSWLSLWLTKLGAIVYGISLPPATEPALYHVLQMEMTIEPYMIDIRNYEKVKAVVDKINPQFIFHLAAQPLVRQSYVDPLETFSTNMMGTANILEAAKSLPELKGILVITTDKCYENQEWEYGYREIDPLGGHDPYSASKACVELIVNSFRKSYFQELDIPIATARAGNVIGGGDWSKDRLIPDFVRASVENGQLAIRSPYATRPWQHVLEPLYGYLLLGRSLMKKLQVGEAWNFGPYDQGNASVEYVINYASSLWKKAEVTMDKSEQPHEANLLKLDISKASSKLNWHPTMKLEEGIEATISWYKAYYEKDNVDMLAFSLNQIETFERKCN